MKWTTHIDYSVNKARKKLGLLRRQSQSLSTKQRIDLYKTMIRPVLEYASVLFDNCSVCDNLKIESCQRTTALICTGAMRRTETKLLLEYLRWDSLEDRRKIFKTSLFYKIIHNQAPLYLSRNITFKQPQTHTLRNTQTINFPRCRLEAYKKSFFFKLYTHLEHFTWQTYKCKKLYDVQKRNKTSLESWNRWNGNQQIVLQLSLFS